MTTKPFFLFRSCLFSSSLGFSERERDYSIVSISMSQYPITSLEWGSCRELVLPLFLTRILTNNRCICMAKFKWNNEAFILHWTIKTWCTLNGKSFLSQYGLVIFEAHAGLFRLSMKEIFDAYVQEVNLQIINTHWYLRLYTVYIFRRTS